MILPKPCLISKLPSFPSHRPQQLGRLTLLPSPMLTGDQGHIRLREKATEGTTHLASGLRMLNSLSYSHMAISPPLLDSEDKYGRTVSLWLHP